MVADLTSAEVGVGPGHSQACMVCGISGERKGINPLTVIINVSLKSSPEQSMYVSACKTSQYVKECLFHKCNKTLYIDVLRLVSCGRKLPVQ